MQDGELYAKVERPDRVSTADIHILEDIATGISTGDFADKGSRRPQAALQTHHRVWSQAVPTSAVTAASDMDRFGFRLFSTASFNRKYENVVSLLGATNSPGLLAPRVHEGNGTVEIAPQAE